MTTTPTAKTVTNDDILAELRAWHQDTMAMGRQLADIERRVRVLERDREARA